MEFECVKCGHCCRSIRVHGIATRSDLKRWRDQGRSDILRYVNRIHFWIDPTTLQETESCPWLRGNLCSVQDTKPERCATYPLDEEIGRKYKCKAIVGRTT